MNSELASLPLSSGAPEPSTPVLLHSAASEGMEADYDAFGSGVEHFHCPPFIKKLWELVNGEFKEVRS